MKTHTGVWKQKWIAIAACLLVVAFVAPSVRADDNQPAVTGKNNPIQLSGVAWVVYRYKVADEPAMEAPNSALGTAGQDLKSASSFDVDRVYLTGDYAISDRYSWQTVLEGSNLGGTLSLFVKKAFLSIKDPFHVKGTILRFGQFGHPLVEQEVDAWGYRSVSRTAVDRYLGISSVWAGIEGNGQVLDGHVDIDAEIANDKGYNAPDEPSPTARSKYKDFIGKVTLIPMPQDATMRGLKVVLFGQYGAKDAPAGLAPSASNNNDKWIGIFPYWKADHFTLGLECVGKTDFTASSNTAHKAVNSRYLGGFGSCDLTGKDRAFVRLDRYITNADTLGPVTTIPRYPRYLIAMLGVSHKYVKNLRTILDMEYTKFDEPAGKTYKADVTVSARAELAL